VTQNSFKKLDLFDLAVARIKNSIEPVIANVGDLIEIIGPFVPEENYLGVVTAINEKNIFVYHGDIRKTLMWHRCVKCNVTKV
jgi:hypothetical protein|tara:strand:- start:117 stop:365 length:249 start_codon:yes stop_codon:yes gene_type:complete